MKKLANILFFTTIFFNIWFPKSGIKIGAIPLTTSNVFYIILLPITLIFILKKKTYKNDKIYFWLLLSIIYFGLRLVLLYFYNINQLSDLIQYIIPLVFYPIIYICSNEIVNDNESLDKVLKIIIFGFIFLAIYSLLQYKLGIDKTTIAGLTANYTDVKSDTYWYLQKNNGVFSYSKLIGTYQNGNLFGINLLLIFPLVFECVCKKSKSKSYVLFVLFIVVVGLTLSRSAWIGIGVYCVLKLFEKNKSYLGIAFKIIFVLLFPFIILKLLQNSPELSVRLLQTDINNINDLSGRLPNAVLMFKSTFNSNNILLPVIGVFGVSNYYGSAYEMTYFAVFMLGGIVGLVLWIYPIFKSVKLFYKNRENHIVKGVVYGLILWIVVANVEGAFWLPPTSLNLWFIISIGTITLRLERRLKCKKELETNLDAA